jgi:hypothetical protein
MRLTMKAGKSSDTAIVLPSLGGEDPWTPRRSSSSVAMPRISSTSFITGTGFMK